MCSSDIDAMVRLGHVSEIDAFFTDTQPPQSIVGALKTNDVDLFIPGNTEELKKRVRNRA